MIGATGTSIRLLVKLKTGFAFFFILFVTASAMGAEVYGFEFITPTPGFSGELFFSTSSGNGSTGSLESNSFITTPDGTFIGSESFAGGPIFNPPPPIDWSPAGITALNLNLYEYFGSQPYNWTATPTSIGDSPVAAIPDDPSASGTWVYVGAIPEPGAPLLMALGMAAMFVRPFRHK